jgi:hypothetical protein
LVMVSYKKLFLWVYGLGVVFWFYQVMSFAMENGREVEFELVISALCTALSWPLWAPILFLIT